MNGKSESIKDQINELENILDQFEADIQLPRILAPLTELELTKYLTLTRDDIEKNLSAAECAHIGYLLLEYALFIQRVINRDKAKVLWAEMVLKKIVAAEISHYGGSWEYQEQQAINANDVASRLQNSIILAKMRNTRLYNIVSSIENMVKQLQNIQYIKKDKT